MYNQIINPVDGQKVDINSSLGKKILKRYLRFFLNHSRGAAVKIPDVEISDVEISDVHSVGTLIDLLKKKPENKKKKIIGKNLR